jgi:S1-C subfamily serine protease
MRRMLFTAVCVCVFQAPMFSADPWHLIVKRLLEKSVVQLSANCSGFVVNEPEDYVMTARHCGPDDPSDPLVVDNIPGKIIYTDVHKDLVVVHVPGLDKPALKFATIPAQYGQELASFGYGGGYETPMLRRAYVAQPKALVPDAGPGEWVMVDAGFVGGQSGAPAVNPEGEVVMIVQMSSALMGIGRSADVIRDRAGKYLQKFPQP